MATVDVYNLKNEKVGEMELDDTVFNTEVKEHLFHEVVRSQLASRRAGTHSTLTRGNINGTTARPWRQKGTGRARHGDRKGNLFVGGGIAFGPLPRSYAYNPPKKVRKAAVRSALSRRFQESRLTVVDSLDLDAPKTREIVAAMNRFGFKSVLFVDERNQALLLSARNLPKAQYLCREGLNTYDILRYENIVLSQAAVEKITGAFAK